jgi:hypothetical protein
LAASIAHRRVVGSGFSVVFSILFKFVERMQEMSRNHNFVFIYFVSLTFPISKNFIVMFAFAFFSNFLLLGWRQIEFFDWDCDPNFLTGSY